MSGPSNNFTLGVVDRKTIFVENSLFILFQNLSARRQASFFFFKFEDKRVHIELTFFLLNLALDSIRKMWWWKCGVVGVVWLRSKSYFLFFFMDKTLSYEKSTNFSLVMIKVVWYGGGNFEVKLREVQSLTGRLRFSSSGDCAWAVLTERMRQKKSGQSVCGGVFFRWAEVTIATQAGRCCAAAARPRERVGSGECGARSPRPFVGGAHPFAQQLGNRCSNRSLRGRQSTPHSSTCSLFTAANFPTVRSNILFIFVDFFYF